MSTKFKILTLNSAFLPKIPGLPNIDLGDNSYRAKHIAKIIKEKDIDIVVLNEVFLNNARSVLIENLRHDFNIPGGQRLSELGGLIEDKEESNTSYNSISTKSICKYLAKKTHENSNLSILEKRKQINELQITSGILNSGLFFAYRKNRGLIVPNSPLLSKWNDSPFPQKPLTDMGYFLIKIGFRRASTPASIHLFGLHMAPYVNNSSIRKKQLKQLNNHILELDRTISKPNLKLVVGDFNIIANTAEHRATLENGILSYSKDQFSSIHPNEPGYTWSEDNPQTYHSEDGGKNERLDYIFSIENPRCSKKFVSNSISIEKMAVTDYAREYASDHFGVVYEFDIENK